MSTFLSSNAFGHFGQNFGQNTSDRIVPSFPADKISPTNRYLQNQNFDSPFLDKSPTNISSYIQNQNLNSPFGTLRRPSHFRPFSANFNQIQESTYGSFMFKQEPIYGYALVQKPCLVPIGSTSVYSTQFMSCYSTATIGNDVHYYVNGDFLAEKLRLEEENYEVCLLFVL